MSDRPAPTFAAPDVALYLGDARDVLPTLPDASVDAVVTDPPAGIAMMGAAWDSDKGGRDAWIAWLASILSECRRVMKPGAHALVWALPRTSHWTGMAIEDAGLECRDVVQHLFGSGFPKSLDVGKAMDKAAGAEREVVGPKLSPNGKTYASLHGPRSGRTGGGIMGEACEVPTRNEFLTAPATDAARLWSGWGTALKPGAEFWWLARKPLIGTVAANVTRHGTGGLNIDACRIEMDDVTARSQNRGPVWSGEFQGGRRENGGNAAGRWPPNVVLSHADCNGECVEGCPVRMLDEQVGELGKSSGTQVGSFKGWTKTTGDRVKEIGYGDTGGASRFYPRFRYVPKAPKRDRGADNRHPTVKNTDLMAWLCRLVTPPGGTVLDPFAGSGSTGVAARDEGFAFVGIEREPEYFATAAERLRPPAQLCLPGLEAHP